MDPALEKALNLLLESERAGVAALEKLISQVKHAELRRFLSGSRAMEQRNADELEDLIFENGGKPSDRTGPFTGKVAALGTVRERLLLMARGQEWAARKTEEALAIAPSSGPVHDYLTAMANRHRAEAEWGRAEVIKLMNPG
ncbi:MAG TPA: DUF6306 domain-containing protein [Candidatus Binataceae bacterium]|nr:DUF6306 domain-containing protein [Candidatus Binataceae bacterium]